MASYYLLLKKWDICVYRLDVTKQGEMLTSIEYFNQSTSAFIS